MKEKSVDNKEILVNNEGIHVHNDEIGTEYYNMYDY